MFQALFGFIGRIVDGVLSLAGFAVLLAVAGVALALLFAAPKSADAPATPVPVREPPGRT